MSCKRFCLFLLACALCFFSCSGDLKSSTGSVTIALPQNSARAARVSEITYNIDIQGTNNYSAQLTVQASKGFVTQDDIPVGSCTIKMDAFYPQAKVPCYSGSCDLFVECDKENVAKISLKKIDYSKQTPLGVNVKLADGFTLIINNERTWDFSKILVQRVFVDGSTDDTFIPSKKLYDVSFDKSSFDYVGNVPFILSGKDGFKKTVSLPARYSMAFPYTKNADFIAALSINSKKTEDGEVLSVNVNDFALNYISENGKESKIKLAASLEDIKWYTYDADGKPVEISEDLITDDGKLNIVYEKAGTFEYFCTASVVLSNKESSKYKISDLVTDNLLTSTTYKTEITQEDLKNTEKDIGEGAQGLFNVTYPEYSQDNRINILCYTEEINDGCILIYLSENATLFDEETYQSIYTLDTTLIKSTEFFVDGNKITASKEQMDDIYYGYGQLDYYNIPVSELPEGAHEIECFMTMADGTVYCANCYYNKR